ncbi:ABC transporter ATP-binding protein [Xanthobacter autotrophicus]|jgi:NitT/TauT family transport system ATP-binding protein|uniref:ABC transporter ATP-binding protein n=1 Tax=Xanthobacter autotrophicus TaxID=280 RepID=A0A6C1KKB8_XANAU|nr:ABC transporter ATP-binding protein [Xanthobacter autotrophicus]TLX44709.1 ABC transporter ATP-binding protein [Xanthobacter autotrophicus]
MSIISMIRKPAPIPLRQTGEVEIDVRDVTIAFERDGGELVPAVDRVSFQVRRGEFICLLGPSGCGKSTLLNAVAGFESPYEGEVVVAGKSVTGPGPDRGVVFQQPRLFPWKSVKANVAHGPRMAGKSRAEAGAIADELIEMVGLTRSANALPHTLSGGMQQRVAIARALANRPGILLMDEPFGALDAQTRSVMQESLLRLWAQLDTTILFVTHDIDEAVLLADRVLVMSAGPGRIIRDVAVDIPRPRTIETTLGADFQALRRECLDLIRQQSQKAFEGNTDA